MIKHIRQQHPMGCTVACVAMVLDKPYEEVARSLGINGTTHFGWQQLLAQHGIACQFIWRTDYRTNKAREVWPLLPWADQHVCIVDGGQGDGTHAVVMLRDGTVLDPGRDHPGRLTDYPAVASMTGLFSVGRHPEPGATP